MKKFFMLLIAGAFALLTGCKDKSAKTEKKLAHIAKPSVPNAVVANELTRTNLGISFANVERRPVRRTYRLPGQFELRPEAFREYTATFGGRVILEVQQYDQVKEGQLLFKLDSPEWRRLQHELGEAVRDMTVKRAEIVVAEKTLEEAESSLKFLQERIKRLAEVKVKKADLDAELVTASKKLEVTKSQKELALKDYKSVQDHYKVMIHTASSFTGIADAELMKSVKKDGEMVPRWRTIDYLNYFASQSGVVAEVGATKGGWAETGTTVVRTVDPQQIRFRAEALQSDLLKFKTGMDARIVAPQGNAINIQDYMTGKVTVGFEGDAQQRTFPLFVNPEKLSSWASSGVSAYLEVFTEGAEKPKLAIPKQCIVRDGLVDVFFRRNPKNPDELLRVEADLGVEDGRWVVVNSGVRKGDEIVLNGAYELKLATAGGTAGGAKKQEKGHFHADGKWCSGDH